MTNEEVMRKAREVANLALLLKEDKLRQYGTRRYEPGRYPTSVSQMLLFADLQRKFQRIEQALIYSMGGESLNDTFLDLINYAIDGYILAEEEGWR